MHFAPLFPVLYRVLHPSFPSCLWHGHPSLPVIALTFDDGPHSQYTPPLLKVLDRYNVPASFFWLGACVDQSPAIARDIYERGHWIGLHGYTHRSFPTLSPDELRQELVSTQMAIAKACQLPPDAVRDVRPPNGFFTPQTLNLLRQWHYRPVMWSVVPEDWVSPGVDVVVRRVLSQTTAGSLIVLHDGSCGGEYVAEIVDRLIPQLLEQGYQFVSIEELRKLHRNVELCQS